MSICELESLSIQSKFESNNEQPNSLLSQCTWNTCWIMDGNNDEITQVAPAIV